MVSPQPKLPSSCPKLPSSLNEATVVRYLGQTCLPSSRDDSFGDYCTKTRKGTSLSFWCKVYNASVFLCSKFERDRWSQRDASRQKLLEASGRVGAILTTVASRGCPQWNNPPRSSDRSLKFGAIQNQTAYIHWGRPYLANTILYTILMCRFYREMSVCAKWNIC